MQTWWSSAKLFCFVLKVSRSLSCFPHNLFSHNLFKILEISLKSDNQIIIEYPVSSCWKNFINFVCCHLFYLFNLFIRTCEMLSACSTATRMALSTWLSFAGWVEALASYFFKLLSLLAQVTTLLGAGLTNAELLNFMREADKVGGSI